MSELITLFEEPALNNPCLIAAWPGMGRVAMTAVNYLNNQLNGIPLGDLQPADFFAPTGATVSRQIVNAPEPPENRFYYSRSSTGGSDIIFFIGSIQPVPHREYAFARELLKVAKRFNVETVYTAAAAPSDMHFKDTPRVFAGESGNLARVAGARCSRQPVRGNARILLSVFALHRDCLVR